MLKKIITTLFLFLGIQIISFSCFCNRTTVKHIGFGLTTHNQYFFIGEYWIDGCRERGRSSYQPIGLKFQYNSNFNQWRGSSIIIETSLWKLISPFLKSSSEYTRGRINPILGIGLEFQRKNLSFLYHIRNEYALNIHINNYIKLRPYASIKININSSYESTPNFNSNEFGIGLLYEIKKSKHRKIPKINRLLPQKGIKPTFKFR